MIGGRRKKNWRGLSSYENEEYANLRTDHPSRYLRVNLVLRQFEEFMKVILKAS